MARKRCNIIATIIYWFLIVAIMIFMFTATMTKLGIKKESKSLFIEEVSNG